MYTVMYVCQYQRYVYCTYYPIVPRLNLKNTIYVIDLKMLLIYYVLKYEGKFFVPKIFSKITIIKTTFVKPICEIFLIMSKMLSNCDLLTEKGTPEV